MTQRTDCTFLSDDSTDNERNEDPELPDFSAVLSSHNPRFWCYEIICLQHFD